MSFSLNRVEIIGHLGADPEVRHTQDGRPVATLRVATSETWKDKATGEKKERTEWHRVVIFSEGLAKVAEQYLKKGAYVFIEGSLATRKWTDKDNVERYTTEIVCKAFNSQMGMLDKQGRPAPSENDYGMTRDKPRAGGVPSATPVAGRRDDMDDEIPF